MLCIVPEDLGSVESVWHRSRDILRSFELEVEYGQLEEVGEVRILAVAEIVEEEHMQYIVVDLGVVVGVQPKKHTRHLVSKESHCMQKWRCDVQANQKRWLQVLGDLRRYHSGTVEGDIGLVVES